MKFLPFLGCDWKCHFAEDGTDMKEPHQSRVQCKVVESSTCSVCMQSCSHAKLYSGINSYTIMVQKIAQTKSQKHLELYYSYTSHKRYVFMKFGNQGHSLRCTNFINTDYEAYEWLCLGAHAQARYTVVGSVSVCVCVCLFRLYLTSCWKLSAGTWNASVSQQYLDFWLAKMWKKWLCLRDVRDLLT